MTIPSSHSDKRYDAKLPRVSSSGTWRHSRPVRSNKSSNLPAGWFIVPSVVIGAIIWAWGLSALYRWLAN